MTLPFAGRTAVVTGAGCGIGLELARKLEEHGAQVTLVDVREEGIEDARKQLTAASGAFHFAVVDVADRRAVEDFAAGQVSVDILVNNAGIALNGRFTDTSSEDFDRVVDVNFQGAVNTTRALLPLLQQSRSAYLVNVASIGAYSAAPGYSSYCASKYALRGFTETMQQEFRDSNVHVLLVCPGGVRTGLERNSLQVLSRQPGESFSEPPGRTSATSAAEQIIRAMLRRKERLLLGADAKYLYAFERVAPGLLNRLVARWVEKQEKNGA